MKILHFCYTLVSYLGAVLCSCGSGSTNEPDLNFGAEEGVATLYGTMYYDGPLTGHEVTVGIVETWPMAGPPKEFIRIPAPKDGFPTSYSMPVSYVGKFYVIAYLDIHMDDSAIFNAEVDPMMMPIDAGDMYEIKEGLNQVDLIFLDVDEVDWWWQ